MMPFIPLKNLKEIHIISININTLWRTKDTKMLIICFGETMQVISPFVFRFILCSALSPLHLLGSLASLLSRWEGLMGTVYTPSLHHASTEQCIVWVP